MEELQIGKVLPLRVERKILELALLRKGKQIVYG